MFLGFRHNAKFWWKLFIETEGSEFSSKTTLRRTIRRVWDCKVAGFNLNSLSFVNIFSVVFHFVLIAKNACICNRRKVFRLRLHFRSSQFVVKFCNVLIRKLNSLFPKKPLHKRLSHRQAFLPLKLPQKKIARVGYFAFPVHRINLGCFGKICLFCPRKYSTKSPVAKGFSPPKPDRKTRMSNKSPPENFDFNGALR